VTEFFSKLQTLLQSDHEIKWKETVVRLAAAIILGVAIAVMHAVFRRRDTRRPGGFGTTLILLTVLVAFVIYVIGDNTARAFGLVGALSIIRFRTAVNDTRDTAFVIFAVAIGMALGAGLFAEAIMVLPAIAVVCLCMMLVGPVVGPGGIIKIRAHSPAEAEAALRDAHTSLRWHKLQSGNTAKKNGGDELIYHVSLKPGASPAHVIDRLRRQPGILRVSWSSG
jgi:uncharacterized membrane protein YhiD involved in acid resistance